MTFGRIFGRLLLFGLVRFGGLLLFGRLSLCNWLPRFGLVRGKRLQLRLSGGGLLPCNWLHLGRSWLDRFGGFHRFGGQLRFG